MAEESAFKRGVKPKLWEVLRSSEKQILVEWQNKAKESLPPGAVLSSLALIDSIPQIIDTLAEALLDLSVTRRLKITSSIHAYERAFLTRHSIEQVLFEYNALREIVIYTLESKTQVSPQEYRVIRKIFDEGIMETAREFVRMKSATDIVTQAETHLVANRLQALQMITEAALTYASDIERLLTEILSMLRNTLEVDTCAIFLLTDGGKNLVIRAAQGIEEQIDPSLRIPATKGVAGQVLKVRYPIILPDLTNVEVASPVLKPAGVRSLMVVPLKIERRPVGVIQVGSLKERIFTKDEQAHMQIVADRVAIAIDHARLYAQIQQDNEILLQERDLRARFVSALTHDLKSPLTAALVGLDLHIRKMEKNETEKERILRVKSNLKRIEKMIENMLDADRIQAGRPIHLNIEYMDLAAEIEAVKQEFLALERRPLHVTSPDHLYGYWCPSGIRRILDNLVTNAMKYGAPNGVISLTLTSAENQAILTVHNEGNPIAESDLKTLFTRFMRTAAAIDSKQKGWGIGLPLVRGIVEAHSGTIRVESSAEQGTTFIISLPLDSRSKNLDD